MFKRIAIIGAGPAGCALACFLRERSIDVLVFDDNKKPGLVVGESLIPAAIPILQRLGIEDEVAQFSELKMGAALRHGSGTPRVDFEFQKLGRNTPEYAYNIPRPQFDAVLRKRAEALGAVFIEHRASVVVADNDPDRDIALSDESLAAANLCQMDQPDLLIDATGRKRLFSKLLKIDADRGPRNDVAHFAHFENYSSDSAIPGQIVISVLDCGWSWQIPLPGKTSVGVVFNKQAAQSYGASAAECLENVMRANPALNKTGFRRISDAMTYSNYQLMSKQGSGNGWVLLGDALGFVDPMLSPGVFMSLESASALDRLLFSKQHVTKQKRQQQLAKYMHEMQQWHDSWSRLIEYFYDGRMLSLGEKRPKIDSSTSRLSPGRLADKIIGGVLSRLVSGVGTRSNLNHVMLEQTCQFLLKDSEFMHLHAIKSSTAADMASIHSTLNSKLEQADDIAA